MKAKPFAPIRCAHAHVWPLAKIRPHPRNPNTHPAEQLRLLAKVITTTGWRAPIVVSKRSGFVTKGHGRLAAAKLAGLKSAPVDVQAYASEAEELADMVADNRLAELAEIDGDALKGLLSELGEGALDMELTGFGEDALAKILADVGGAVTDAGAEEPTPELTKKWRVKVGQVWTLGRHRIACGDSSDPRVIRAVMGEDHPDVTIVDPPFECSDSEWSKWIQDPCIVFGQAVHMRMIPAKLWRFERVVVKRHQHRSATVQILHGHAFVAQCGTKKTLPRAKGLTFPSVIQQEAETDHDHQKPVALLVEHLQHWTPPGRIVLDPFLGSGTTILACEQCGRDCRGAELCPDRFAVILQRWLDTTGVQPIAE